jgi:hypothetical protein
MPALSEMSRNAREATSRRYTRLGNWARLVAELPTEFAGFRKIKGSVFGRGRPETLKHVADLVFGAFSAPAECTQADGRSR